MNLCIGVIHKSMADPGNCITETSASARLIIQQISILSILYIPCQVYISNENSSPPSPTNSWLLLMVIIWRGLLRQPGPLVSFSRLCLPSERECFSPEQTATQPPLAGQLRSLCVFPYAWRLEGENWLPTWLASTNLSSGFHMVFLLYLREGQKERKKENLPLLILFDWVFPLMTSLRLHYHLKSLPP